MCVMQAAIEASAQSLLIRDNIQLVSTNDAVIIGLINENFKLSWDKVNPVNGMLNFLLPYPDVIWRYGYATVTDEGTWYCIAIDMYR